MIVIDTLVPVAPGTGAAQQLKTEAGMNVCNKMRVQAHPDNEGKIFLGRSPSMTPTRGVFAILPAGATEWLGDEDQRLAIDVQQWYVLAENVTDKILGGIWIR